MVETLVLITLSIPDTIIDNLNSEFPNVVFRKTNSKEEVLSVASSAEILVMISPSSDIVNSARKCKWIQSLTAGMEDFLELDGVKSNKKLILTNASGIHGTPISEHVLALALAHSRKIKEAILNQEKKSWVGFRDAPPGTEELAGKTMLLAGLGTIGLQSAKKAKAFGMKTIAVKHDLSKPPKDPSFTSYVDELRSTAELSEVIKKADVVVDSLPLTKETQRIFDSRLFSKMKDRTIFINVGRGRTVVERDLIEGLRSGRPSAAGLDVFEEEPLPDDSPLWAMKNVIITPHISGWTSRYIERGMEIFKDNLRRYLSGQRLQNVVDIEAGY